MQHRAQPNYLFSFGMECSTCTHYLPVMGRATLTNPGLRRSASLISRFPSAHWAARSSPADQTSAR
jgi:hypothetical protein